MTPSRRLESLLICLLSAGLMASASCASESATAGGNARRYTPRTRTITITTVPMLVKAEQNVLPFLRADFAKGGVLDGKEVRASFRLSVPRKHTCR